LIAESYYISYFLCFTQFHFCIAITGKLNKSTVPISSDKYLNWVAQQMAWIMVSLAISLVLTYFLGWWGIIPAIGIFIGISYYMRKRAMARMGMSGGGGFGGMLGGGGGINYVCIACGHRFKGGACPRCGSKMRRADF